MTAMCFVDTNILLYAASNAVQDQPKRHVARGLLMQPDIGFSAQVLQEFYAAAVAKKHLQMTHDEAVIVLQSLAAFPVRPITRELVLDAIDAKQRFGISYWDAAIAA
jgi:predicted nucleic acid-binding protein